MKDFHSQTVVPLTPVRGIICGRGLQLPCELLLDDKSSQGATNPAKPSWTVLRAPADLPDGDYVVIAEDGRRFQARHVDGFWTHLDGSELSRVPGQSGSRTLSLRSLREMPDRLLEFDRRHAVSLMLFAALITYVLPTVVELIAAHDPGFGFGVIVFGDLTGCACLAALLGMPMFGVVLYVLLSVFEACLYFTGVLSATTMAWFVDILPTLVVAGRIARLHSVRFAQR